MPRPRGHVHKSLLLAGAKTRFPFLREDLRDLMPGRLDDHGVEVGERQTEPHGEQSADGRLATARRPI